MSEQPWWFDIEADALLDSTWVPYAPDGVRDRLVRVDVQWLVRVDVPHPRRREKAGELINMADGRMALAARSIWAGWTPGIRLVVTLKNGVTVTSPWAERMVCCDMHNTNCEPPSELCCEFCSEMFHPKHAVMPCVLAHEGSGDDDADRR